MSIEAEDLATGQRVEVEDDDPRLITVGVTDGELAVLVDRDLADALAADLPEVDALTEHPVSAFADHLVTRAGVAVLRGGHQAHVPVGEQRLLALLGHAGPAEDYEDAWAACEELLSKRFPAWGEPRSGTDALPPRGFVITDVREVEG